MKTFCTILFSLLMFASCRQDQLEYSCDPVINDYVSIHKAEFLKYAVVDLATSDPLMQQAIFRSFTPEKKREIWLQKIHYLLDNEPYSAAEYAHVEKLLDQLHENYFSKENLELEANLRSQFASNWINYAKNSLGWSNKYIAFVVFRVYTSQVQFDAEISALKVIRQNASANTEGGTCNCNTGNDYCPSMTNCGAGSCMITTGCGWFWTETCNGECKY